MVWNDLERKLLEYCGKNYYIRKELSMEKAHSRSWRKLLGSRMRLFLPDANETFDQRHNKKDFF